MKTNDKDATTLKTLIDTMYEQLELLQRRKDFLSKR